MSQLLRLFQRIRKRLVILVVVPLLVLSLLLLLLGFGLHAYPLVVCNQDQGFDLPLAGHLNVPELLVTALDRKAFALSTTATLAEAQARFEAGQAKALLYFPPDLSQDLMIRQDDPSYQFPKQIQIKLSESNPLARLMVLASIMRSSFKAVQDSGASLGSGGLPLPLDLPGLSEGFALAPSYLVAALAGFLAWVLTGLMALGAAKDWRRRDQFEPGNSLGLTVSFCLAFALAGTLFYLGLLSVASWVFGLSFSAGQASSALAVLLLGLVAAALALAVTMAVPRLERATVVVPVLILPLFFGAFLFPAELLPLWLQWFKYLLPPFYGLQASLSLALGQSQGLVESLVAMGLWALALLALASLSLGRAVHRSSLSAVPDSLSASR